MNVLKQPSNNYQKRWLVAVMEQDLTPATKLVAMFLREIWWNDVGTPDEPTNHEIYASYEQIQRATHLSRDSITKAINALEDEGFLHQTNRSRKQGVANRYYPVRIDKVIESIADDYLNPDLSNLPDFTSNLPVSTTNLPEEQGVNSKEIVTNSFTEEETQESVIPLDSEASNARSEHKQKETFTQKAHKRQDDINAEFRALMGIDD
jgi:hypothetical protein